MRALIVLVLLVPACRARGTGSPARVASAGEARRQLEIGGFVARVGGDTVLVERFARRGDSLEVEQVRRSPAPAWRTARFALSPAGRLSGMYVTHDSIGAPPGTRPLASTRFTVDGDSATTALTMGDSAHPARRVPVARSAIPALRNSYLPYHLAARRLRTAGAESVAVVFVLAGGGSTPVVVRAHGADSMTFAHPEVTYRGRVDGAGRLLGLRAYRTVRDTVAEWVPAPDVRGIAARWSTDRRD
jgi:hypothetical protein